MDRYGFPVLFSEPHRTYRYVLWRVWNESLPYLCVIGLNPSTADENVPDPTLKKCCKYAEKFGYGSLCMVNLFAYRTKNPKVCFAARDPVGPDNDKHLRAAVAGAGMVLAAWGNDGARMGRADHVRRMLAIPMHCLAINDTGQPAHPLYQPDNATPILMPELPSEVYLDDESV
jgi:hypothetical protein